MRGAGCGVRDAGCGADMVSLRETNLFIWPSALIYPRARDTITGHGTRTTIQTNDSIPITIRTRSTGPLPNYDAGHLHEPRNTNHESRKPLKFSNRKNKPHHKLLRLRPVLPFIDVGYQRHFEGDYGFHGFFEESGYFFFFLIDDFGYQFIMDL